MATLRLHQKSCSQNEGGIDTGGMFDGRCPTSGCDTCFTTNHSEAQEMKSKNKYQYLFVLQGNYGYGDGWEDLTASDHRKDVRAALRSYHENEGGRYRIIRRRELNI